MKIKDVMTRTPQCIAPDESIRQAARRMKEHDIGVLPVCSDDRLIGMITDRDLALRAVAEGSDPESTSVHEAMTPSIVFCFDDEDLESAIDKMEERRIRRLLVLNRSKRLVGILSLGDIATRVRDDRLCAEVLGCVSEPSHSRA
jgi:CBS domain-containing protein